MKNGWERKRLVDFTAAVSTGPFGSLLHKSDYVDIGVPLVNPINIVGDRIIPDPSKLIDKATKRRLGSYVLQEGDIVVGRRGEIGRCAVIGPNESGWVCGTGSFFIRPLPSMDSRFLAHLIRSDDYREKLEQAATGTTMMNLSNTALGDLLIAIPPLPEQQRIVGILEEAFDSIAAAKTNAEKNLQNARALFASHLESVFTSRGKGWVEKPIAECFQVRSGDFLPAKAMVETGYFDVYGGNGVNGRHNQKNLTGRNIIIGRVGAKCGNVRCVDGDLWVTDNAFYISKYFHDFDPAFLARLLERKQLRSTANQAAQPVISYTTIKGVLLEYPSDVSVQKEIAKALDPMEAETQRLESIYQQKLAALEALKRSLLHQAFAGRL